jgi:type IV pilus assembly protein PilB
LSMQLGLPMLEPTLAMIDRLALERIPPKILIRHGFLPLRHDGGLFLACADPLDREAVGDAKRFLGSDIDFALASASQLRKLQEQLLSRGRTHPVAAMDKTVVGTVNAIIMAALAEDASDIHIEPMMDHLQVRFREDGVLRVYKEYPLDIIPSMVSRIKVMCKADIAERRRHQEGRILFAHPDGELDIRVSIYVTVHGEKVVMRLLNRKQEIYDIQSIGMAPVMLSRFLEDAVHSPSGVLLVTGPTGSGKTSTIYSCIHHIKNPQISIITAEEPVEYVIDGIAQCSINPEINLSFEETLRHIVRQDPDVIVIGEIRDSYSAEVAVQAALTGHKVFSTFHTEDSIGGLIRLMNMEIAPFLISSTVVSVLAQRLLRRICPHCSVPSRPSAHQIHRLGLSPAELLAIDFRRGRGCSNCKYTGYKGRIGVFELLVLDEPIRDAILQQQTSHQIRQIGIESTELVTLFEDGLVKAAAGLTTIDELLRCLPRLTMPRSLDVLRRLSGARA